MKDQENAELFGLLKGIVSYRPLDETVRALIDSGERMVVKANTPIVEEASVSSDVILIEDGLARLAYFNGQQEVTFGFGTAGTLFLSPKGFCRNLPSFFSIHACTEVTVRRTSRQKFNRMIEESHDMAKWMFDIGIHQFCACELRTETMSASAQERYESVVNKTAIMQFETLEKNRPDIANVVSSKVLASYLGITQSYLSNIRKKIIEERKKGK